MARLAHVAPALVTVAVFQALATLLRHHARQTRQSHDALANTAAAVSAYSTRITAFAVAPAAEARPEAVAHTRDATTRRHGHLSVPRVHVMPVFVHDGPGIGRVKGRRTFERKAGLLSDSVPRETTSRGCRSRRGRQAVVNAIE